MKKQTETTQPKKAHPNLHPAYVGIFSNPVKLPIPSKFRIKGYRTTGIDTATMQAKQGTFTAGIIALANEFKSKYNLDINPYTVDLKNEMMLSYIQEIDERNNDSKQSTYWNARKTAKREAFQRYLNVKNTPDTPSGKTSYTPEAIPAGYDPQEIITKSILDYVLTELCKDKTDKQICKWLVKGYSPEEIAKGSEAVRKANTRTHRQAGRDIEGLHMTKQSVSERIGNIRARIGA